MWFDRITRDAGCASAIGCYWIPAGDAGMVEWRRSEVRAVSVEIEDRDQAGRSGTRRLVAGRLHSSLSGDPRCTCPEHMRS